MVLMMMMLVVTGDYGLVVHLWAVMLNVVIVLQ